LKEIDVTAVQKKKERDREWEMRDIEKEKVRFALGFEDAPHNKKKEIK